MMNLMLKRYDYISIWILSLIPIFQYALDSDDDDGEEKNHQQANSSSSDKKPSSGSEKRNS